MSEVKATMKEVLSFVDPPPQSVHCTPFGIAVWHKRLLFSLLRSAVVEFRKKNGDRLLNEHLLRPFATAEWFMSMDAQHIAQLFEANVTDVAKFILKNFVKEADVAGARHEVFVLGTHTQLMEDNLLNILLHLRRGMLRWKLLDPTEVFDVAQLLDSVKRVVDRADDKSLAESWNRLHKLDRPRGKEEPAEAYFKGLFGVRAAMVGVEPAVVEQKFLDLDAVVPPASGVAPPAHLPPTVPYYPVHPPAPLPPAVHHEPMDVDALVAALKKSGVLARGGKGGGGGCHNCGQQGHMARECPSNNTGYGAFSKGGGSGSGGGGVVCRNFLRQFRCPTNPCRYRHLDKATLEREGRCFTCGEDSHLSKACPYKQGGGGAPPPGGASK